MNSNERKIMTMAECRNSPYFGKVEPYDGAHWVVLVNLEQKEAKLVLSTAIHEKLMGGWQLAGRIPIISRFNASIDSQFRHYCKSRNLKPIQ